MAVGTSSAQLVDDTKKASYSTQYLGAFSACLGALCFGVVIGYSSPAGALLTRVPNNETDNCTDSGLHLSQTQNSWFASSINIGAALGGPIGGLFINAIGRRRSMLLTAVVFLSAWILTIFAQNFAMLISSRIISGLGTGMVCIAANTYVGEIASVDIRGTLGSGFQLMVVIGVLLAYIFGTIMDTWRLLAVVCAIPTLVYFFFMFISKESPVYLLSKRREMDAESSLQFYRGKDYNVQRELDMMRDALDEAKKNETSMKDLFVNSYLLKPLLISLALMFFQQASGVNAVIFNLASIFKDAGTGISEDLSSIMVGLVQVIATVASTLLIDRAGRKILLIGSSTVMGISLVALGVFFYQQEQGVADSLGWLPLTSLMLFITSFSLGYGPIPWLMMSELFPRAVAGEASSISTMTNWSMSFVCTLIFAPLKDTIHDYGVYWMFAGICFVNMLFCIFIVPETKGKTIEEISSYFGAPSPLMEDPAKSKEKGKKIDLDFSL